MTFSLSPPTSTLVVHGSDEQTNERAMVCQRCNPALTFCALVAQRSGGYRRHSCLFLAETSAGANEGFFFVYTSYLPTYQFPPTLPISYLGKEVHLTNEIPRR